MDRESIFFLKRFLLVLLVAAFAAGVSVPARSGPLTLAISADRSTLEFTVSRPGETIQGKAPRFTGELLFDPVRPSEGSVVLRVEAAAMVTGNRLRDRKMRNSHLETDRFPAIGFRSTAVSFAGDSSAQPSPGLRAGETRVATIEGTLALHGQEHAIRFPVSIRYDDATLAAEGTLSLKLSDYAIPIPGFLWMKLDDEVQVHFRFVAAPSSAVKPAGGEPPP